jgi:hypothetical protein
VYVLWVDKYPFDFEKRLASRSQERGRGRRKEEEEEEGGRKKEVEEKERKKRGEEEEVCTHSVDGATRACGDFFYEFEDVVRILRRNDARVRHLNGLVVVVSPKPPNPKEQKRKEKKRKEKKRNRRTKG